MCIRGNVCPDGMYRHTSTQRIRILRPSKKSVDVFECVCEIIYRFCLFIFAFLHLFLLFAGVAGIVTDVGCNNSDLNEHRSYSSSCVGQMQLLIIVYCWWWLTLCSIPRARFCLSKGERARG